MTRNTLTRSLVVAFLSFATFGCTSQPLAPSALPTISATPTAAIAAPSSTPTAATSAAGGRPASGGVIYVASQGLYYDTFVAHDPLPMQGRFQPLVNGTTEFGPGDPGYLGGRWWEDLNGNGVQDAGDHFFECPLLPPGRPTL
jgi:hypothetical protein